MPSRQAENEGCRGDEVDATLCETEQSPRHHLTIPRTATTADPYATPEISEQGRVNRLTSTAQNCGIRSRIPRWAKTTTGFNWLSSTFLNVSFWAAIRPASPSTRNPLPSGLLTHTSLRSGCGAHCYDQREYPSLCRCRSQCRAQVRRTRGLLSLRFSSKRHRGHGQAWKFQPYPRSLDCHRVLLWRDAIRIVESVVRVQVVVMKDSR